MNRFKEEQAVRVPGFAWYGDGERTLSFPRGWDVQCSLMAGHEQAAMGDDEIRRCLSKPLGCPPLRELAKGKKDVVILFDDLTRPTPAFRIVPFILEELKEAKIRQNRIRFVAATGNHRAMTGQEMIKKLGEEVVSHFPVFNHNPYEGNRYLGKTTRGTPVRINREVAACDLKIGIGSILPHFSYGFGGGAKIVLPGVSALSSSFYNHFHVGMRGGKDGDPKTLAADVREDMEEAARIAGLNLKIDCILNPKREAIALFAGDVTKAFRRGCQFAKKTYVSPLIRDADVAVVNTYPIESEPVKSSNLAIRSVRKGGDIVFVAHSAEGPITHYLYDRFGSRHGGKLWKYHKEASLGDAARVIVYSPKRFGCDIELYGPRGKTFWFATWGRVLKELEVTHGSKAKVAIYPYTPLQRV